MIDVVPRLKEDKDAVTLSIPICHDKHPIDFKIGNTLRERVSILVLQWTVMVCES